MNFLAFRLDNRNRLSSDKATELTGLDELVYKKGKVTMYAERLILETDQSGHIKNYPKLPPNKQFEVIFLGVDEENKTVKREPHPDIAGKVEIMGDIFDSTPASDWSSSL